MHGINHTIEVQLVKGIRHFANTECSFFVYFTAKNVLELVAICIYGVLKSEQNRTCKPCYG